MLQKNELIMPRVFNEDYNKLVDKFNQLNKTRLEDNKLLRILLNLCDEKIIEKAIKLIEKKK